MLLSYRIPREPSTPRIAIWRKLNQLGVAKVGDGLVALPNDARTKEHFEWLAAQIEESNGDAIVWVASTVRSRQSEALARQMRDARDAEYQSLIDDVSTTPIDARTLGRWRREWRRIDRRDYFRAPLRDSSREAIEAVLAIHRAAGSPI